MLAYEELKGSSGRQIFFRPQRFASNELFRDTPPKVMLHGQEFRLANLSLTGASVNANQSVEVDFTDGDILPIDIKQSGVSIMESRARVMRTERHPFGTRVALQFSQQLRHFDPTAIGIVPAEYRAHCADVLHFLRAYRGVIDASQHAMPGRKGGLSPDTAYEICETSIIPQWRKLWLAGNQLVAPAMTDKLQLEAIKTYTEAVLTPEFCNGPVWWRSYRKPAGYPGDFEIMNYVYDWQREGQDIYGQLIHRIGLDVSECIATRMDVVRQEIRKTVEAHAESGGARIVSLGCGSAREVQLHLQDQTTLDGPVTFTLIDQEANALAYAYEKCHPHTVTRKRHARVQALNVSFTDVLRGGKWLDDLGPQSLVYTVGLVDYLVDKRARSLAERLYERLEPGGLLIIGNMNLTELSNLWPMEFITDWHLYYRTEEDMLAWTGNMAHATAWTELETTGRVRLLFVRKKA
jgi:extracellular factor (EF) 3-hydroxypalmitic acid methyl ester biosynthesis protein